MKKTKKLLCIIIAVVMLMSALPMQSFAWKTRVHLSTADIIRAEIEKSFKLRGDGTAAVTIYAPYDDHENGGKEYVIPDEYRDAIMNCPSFFRAGALGPDFYPDIATGQMYIHPYDKPSDIGSGEWIEILCESVEMLPAYSRVRAEALAFTLGYILHYCGDLFGHDFVNCFAGGVFPDLTSVDWENVTGAEHEVNVVLSHMAVEAYMDSFVTESIYDEYSLNAPTEFVANSLIYNGSANSGPAVIFEKYGSMPPQYSYLIELRQTLYNKANEWRESINPYYTTLVAYVDAWVADIDRATYALIDAFDEIAREMGKVAVPDTYAIVSTAITGWIDEYAVYVTPVPDTLTNVLKFPGDAAVTILELIGAEELLQKFEKWVYGLVGDAVLWIMGIPEEVIEAFEERLGDPVAQLDHKDNPFDPTGNKTNFAEFSEYMEIFRKEQELVEDVIENKTSENVEKLADSQLEAFYNTMVMFKLFLIGPENFSSLIRDLTGKEQDMYKNSTVSVKATSLKLEIKTADAQNAGTDDNIFAVAYELDDEGNKKKLIKKLLDISVYNDFESGDLDTYTLEFPYPVSVDRIEVSIEQDEKVSAYSGWNCENINITPMHAGIEVFPTVGVGGNEKMDSGKKWDLRYQNAIKVREIENKASQEVTNLELDIKTKDKLGSGTDGDVYLLAYNSDYSTSEPWVKVLLDKDGYNDFEAGDNDTYTVSLTKYISDRQVQGIPLDKLSIAIKIEDNSTAAIGWDIDNMDMRIYYGNLELTEEINLGSRTNLNPDDNATWLIDDIQERIDGQYKEHYPLETERQSTIDGGIISYMKSLDDSTQWVNEENILWSDVDIREKVFFKLFKGFSPEIEYEGMHSAERYGTIDGLEIKLTGKWNGIASSRRNEGTAGVDAPAVTGTASLTFIDSDGNEAQAFEDVEVTEKADGTTVVALDNYSHNLKTGVYGLKVAYTSDEKQSYAPAEAYFENALEIWEPHDFTVTVSSSDINAGTATGGGTFTERTDVTVTAKDNIGYHFVSWQENGAAVSEDKEYTFNLQGNRDLLGVFEACELQYQAEIPADCEEDGKEAYYACACGKCYEDAEATIIIEDIDSWGILPAKGHSYSDQWSYDETHHWHDANCGHELQKDMQAHYGGEATEESRAVCEVCGQEYGDYLDGFRCDMCSTYEYMKDTPIIGIFFKMVHFFYHFAMYIGYLT